MRGIWVSSRWRSSKPTSNNSKNQTWKNELVQNREGGVSKGGILSSHLFNLYAEYIIQNAGLDEAQAGTKIARRNINNLRYGDDTSLRAESKDELKIFLMKEKQESEKVGLKLYIQKTKIIDLIPSLHEKQMGEIWTQCLTLFS